MTGLDTKEGKIISGDPEALGFELVKLGDAKYWIHVVLDENGRFDEKASVVYSHVGTETLCEEVLEDFRKKVFRLYHEQEERDSYKRRRWIDLDSGAGDRNTQRRSFEDGY